MIFRLQLKSVVGLILWLVVFTIYIFSACRVNPSFADSDEIITNSYLLSVAHAPGYPLQIVLNKIFMLLPVGGTIAFKANLFAGFVHSLAVLLAYLTGLEILKFFYEKEDIRKQKLAILTSLFGSLILAFNGLFWLYSAIFEVHSLNDFLAILIIWLSFKWFWLVLGSDKISKKEFWLYIAICFLAGVGLSHVQTYVLILPGLFLMLIFALIKGKKWKQYGFKTLILLPVIFAIGFILPNLLLFPLNARQKDVSWYFPQNIAGWYFQVRRKAYSGYIPERNIQVGSYVAASLDFSKYIKSIPGYWYYVNSHYSGLGVILGLVALSWLIFYHRKKWDLILILSAFVFIPGMILGIYMSFPQDSSSLDFNIQVGISHRQYLIGETTYVLFIIIGLWALIDFASRYLNLKKNEILIFIIVLGTSLSVWSFADNFKMGYQKNNTHAWDYALEVLNHIPKDSVLVCFSDFACFSLLYAQEVEKIRQDVVIITKNRYIKYYFFERNPDYKLYVDTDNPYFSADIITWNLYKNRQVYLADAPGYYVDYIGLDGKPFYLIPEGYLFKVVKKIPEQINTEYKYDISNKLLSYDIPKKNLLFYGQRDFFANFHTIAGTLYAHLNKTEAARKNLKLAMEFSPNYKYPQNIFSGLDIYHGSSRYKPGQESSPSSFYFAEYERLLSMNGGMQEAYKNLQKVIFLEPENLQYRLMLADMIFRAKFWLEAKLEYETILKLDPQNNLAQQRLEEIGKQIGSKRI